MDRTSILPWRLPDRRSTNNDRRISCSAYQAEHVVWVAGAAAEYMLALRVVRASAEVAVVVMAEPAGLERSAD